MISLASEQKQIHFIQHELKTKDLQLNIIKTANINRSQLISILTHQVLIFLGILA